MQTQLLKGLYEAVRTNRTYKKKKIFLVGENAIAKRNNKESAEHEYEMGKHLFEHGVQVPEFYTLAFVLGNWYTIMQKIEGIETLRMPETFKEKVVPQYRAELEKILGLGICPTDSTFGGNLLFDTKAEKLYFIDFEIWIKGSPQQVGEYTRMLNRSDSQLFDMISGKMLK